MNPEEFANDWAQGAKARLPKWLRKIKAVRESPCQQAAARGAYWQQRVSSPAALEKFQRKLNAIGIEAWRTQTVNKGQLTYSAGIEGAKPKMAKMASLIQAAGDAAKAAAKSVDKTTDTDGMLRIQAAQKAIREAWAGKV